MALLTLKTTNPKGKCHHGYREWGKRGKKKPRGEGKRWMGWSPWDLGSILSTFRFKIATEEERNLYEYFVKGAKDGKCNNSIRKKKLTLPRLG